VVLDAYKAETKSNLDAVNKLEIEKTGCESERKCTESCIERNKKNIETEKSQMANCKTLVESYKVEIKNLRDKVIKLNESLKNVEIL
jgi:predicted RNase H-like nuclease (RuvC/YqgF family)